MIQIFDYFVSLLNQSKYENLLASVKAQFTVDELSRIVEMAWEDRTPFEAIEHNFGLNESAVIKIMRSQVKPRSFKLWRERVTSRNTKHLVKRSPDVSRGYCPTQYKNR